MKSLDEQIKHQYAIRVNKDGIYNSVYAQLSYAERLRETIKLITKYKVNDGNVLEVGAGQGSNVDLLRACGFSDDRIFLNELLNERIDHIKANYSGIKIYEGNALELEFNQLYNCVFQSTVFTSLLNNEDRIKLASKMWNLLKPGGIILWYDFIYNNPKNRAVKKVSIKEVKNLFPEAIEVEIHKITLSPPVGRRVGKMYNVFNLPILRSHILAVFKK
jgi:phospholipid N-methyltransferase